MHSTAPMLASATARCDAKRFALFSDAARSTLEEEARGEPKHLGR